MARYGTMRFPPLALLGTALLAIPLSVSAQTAPAPAPQLTNEQTESILKQLDQIETVITQRRTETMSTALSRVRAASRGPKEALDLYLACIKIENYDKRNLKQADFQAWRDQNEARLSDPDFLTGLQLQLEYLTLCIMVQDVREPADMAPIISALQAYLTRAVTEVQATTKHSASGAVVEKDNGRGPRGGARPGRAGAPGNNQLLSMLRQSVKGTEFSRAMNLDENLRRKEWVYSPGDFREIYNGVIFPHFSVHAPAELPAQWDLLINLELAVRKSVLSELEFEEYYKEQHPQLVWAKASYLLDKNVSSISALADMLKIVRDNPNHPQAGEWVKQLRGAVTKSQATPAATVLTTPSAAPVPAP